MTSVTSPLIGTTGVTPSTTSSRGRAALVAGVAHPLAWIAGLALWSGAVDVDVNASDATVLAAYSEAGARAAVQSGFVHGVAGVALAVVAVSLVGFARRTGHATTARILQVGGIGAAVVSLVQFAVEQWLCLVAAPAGDASGARLALEITNRLDGVKMVLLAIFAVGGLLLALRRLTPRWVGALGLALAIIITASGIGYAFLIPPLTSLALISGPVLLAWVPSIAITTWRVARRRSA